MNSTLKKFPPKLEISVPRFIPNAIENEINSEKIGVITGFCISNQEGGYQLKSQSGVVPRGNRNEEKNGENISKEVSEELQFIDTIETKIRGRKNIACTNDRNLWVAGNDETPIQLFKCNAPVNVSYLSFGTTNSSLILKNVQAGEGQKSFAVTKTGDLIFGRRLSNKISIFKEDKTDELLNLNKWRLLSLCITANGGLLVCMTDDKDIASRVVRFESSKERQIVQYDKNGKKLFAHGKNGKNVKENRNGDICVADYDGKAVVVTDKRGIFKFRYTSLYCPLGIATDSQAQIIVRYTPAVHIIDRIGNHIHKLNIHELSFEDIGLDIDNEDFLYLADTDGTVKKIQYMKQLNE
uniref:Uncharacterized protein LOC111105154 n=1 Tax=Crassostrea virginica TaxID=6565 RepID=A0A8B8AV16_CRAVI|nr:uncharacterized protein LOC111105154 [Crassostrea virginica]